MRITSSQLAALGIYVSLAILSGCGSAPSTFAPATPSNSISQGPWMSSQAKQVPQLLYVANASNPPAVYVYSYPQAKLVGTLTGFSSPGGECSDKAGHVWITDNNSTIVEYAHGGSTPIATLSDPDYFPIDCSVDPVTGNLAVTSDPVSGLGNVSIYTKARGAPKQYSAQFLPVPLYCGYDDRGNLFVDGLSYDTYFALAELPFRNSGLFPVSVNQSIGRSGGVLWYGKYLAVGDPSANTVYEFAISGNQGTEVSSTPLDESNGVLQFWIAGSYVIGGDGTAAYYWPYPAGGNPTKAIVGFTNVAGATLSRIPTK